MDIVFSHETALQICAQLKTGGNGETLLRRSSKDFHTTYSACSTEAYEEKLLFLKKEYGIVLAQTTHEYSGTIQEQGSVMRECLISSSAFCPWAH